MEYIYIREAILSRVSVDFLQCLLKIIADISDGIKYNFINYITT